MECDLKITPRGGQRDGIPVEAIPRELREYETAEGASPFGDWIGSLRDKRGGAIIRIRVNRIQQGNFGNCEPVGEGVQELKINFGPGYRVYFGVDGDQIVLLGGGDKSTQSADIREAQRRWSDYNG